MLQACLVTTYGLCAPATHGVGPAGPGGQRRLRGLNIPIPTRAGPVGAPQLKAGRREERGDDGLQLVTRESGKRGPVAKLKKTDWGLDKPWESSSLWGRALGFSCFAENSTPVQPSTQPGGSPRVSSAAQQHPQVLCCGKSRAEGCRMGCNGSLGEQRVANPAAVRKGILEKVAPVAGLERTRGRRALQTEGRECGKTWGQEEQDMF